jgi:hypothetical protein
MKWILLILCFALASPSFVTAQEGRTVENDFAALKKASDDSASEFKCETEMSRFSVGPLQKDKVVTGGLFQRGDRDYVLVSEEGVYPFNLARNQTFPVRIELVHGKTHDQLLFTKVGDTFVLNPNPGPAEIRDANGLDINLTKLSPVSETATLKEINALAIEKVFREIEADQDASQKMQTEWESCRNLPKLTDSSKECGNDPVICKQISEANRCTELRLRVERYPKQIAARRNFLSQVFQKCKAYLSGSTVASLDSYQKKVVKEEAATAAAIK